MAGLRFFLGAGRVKGGATVLWRLAEVCSGRPLSHIWDSRISGLSYAEGCKRLR